VAVLKEKAKGKRRKAKGNSELFPSSEGPGVGSSKQKAEGSRQKNKVKIDK
jgi:hypothetical protein